MVISHEVLGHVLFTPDAQYDKTTEENYAYSVGQNYMCLLIYGESQLDIERCLNGLSKSTPPEYKVNFLEPAFYPELWNLFKQLKKAGGYFINSTPK